MFNNNTFLAEILVITTPSSVSEYSPGQAPGGRLPHVPDAGPLSSLTQYFDVSQLELFIQYLFPRGAQQEEKGRHGETGVRDTSNLPNFYLCQNITFVHLLLIIFDCSYNSSNKILTIIETIAVMFIPGI